MEINKLLSFKTNKNSEPQTSTKQFGISCPNLGPLKKDTISFKGPMDSDEKEYLNIQKQIDNINLTNFHSLDISKIKEQIRLLTDPILKNEYEKALNKKLARLNDNISRQKLIKEKLEEYKTAYALDEAAYMQAQEDGSYYTKSTKSFSYWTNSDKAKEKLNELLGHPQNNKAAFYADELFDASKTGYIEDGSIAYPFLSSKVLSGIVPYEWKNICYAIQFSNRIIDNEHINPYETVKVLRNLDSPIYTKEIKEEIKNLYGIDLDLYKETLVNWLDTEYSNSEKIQISKDSKINLIQNILNNKKMISGNTEEIKIELESGIPILKNKSNTETIIKELKNLEIHPEFNKLDNIHKTIAKWHIITQGMSFKEMATMFNEYSIPHNIQNKIIYSTLKDTQALAASIINNQDIDMMSILDDIKQYNDISYKRIDFKELKSNIAKINEVNNQNFIFSNTPITSAIPTQKIRNHGKDYNIKFLDLKNPKVLANLEDYGFLPGTTHDDIEFVVHMFGQGKEEISLTKLYNAINEKEAVVLSTSLTNGTNRLYDNSNIGVIVDYVQNSILNAYNEDLVSGRDKNNWIAPWFHKTTDGSYSRVEGQEYIFLKESIKNKLGLNDSEYNKLSNYLKNKKSITQIKDIQIGNKRLSGSTIQNAVKESQKKLFTGHKGYNEIEIFNPAIKAIYLRDIDTENVPSYIFEYAQKHNLPVICQ